MSFFRRHTDVVSTMEEFTTRYEQGIYITPWVVYVGNDNEGYSVIYSNDVNNSLSNEPELIDSLINRIQKLETEKVYCYENEYEELISKGNGWVTNLDGTRTEVVFDVDKIYCIYEEEGPVSPEEPVEPSEPETDEDTEENPEETV